jgi:hypothetical protein
MADFYKRGQHSTNDRTNLISAWTRAAGANIGTFRRTDGSQTGYLVPVGKKLIITRLQSNTASEGGSTYALHIEYADTDTGLNSASHGTSFVRVVGTGAANETPFHVSGVGQFAGGIAVWDVWMEIPAQKYVACQVNPGPAGAWFDGHLVDA